MLNWVYFIQSNGEYHKLMDFLESERDVSGLSYFVYNEEVRCNDGKVFSKDNAILLAVHFFTHSLDPKEKMTDFSLNSNLLISLYDIVCDDDDWLTKGRTITEKAKRFYWEIDLKKFLDNLHFRFIDDSELTLFGHQISKPVS